MTPFQRFRKYLSHYWHWLALSVACVLLMNVAKLAAPLVLGRAVDSLRAGIAEAQLRRYAGVLVLLALAQAAFIFLQQLLFARVSRSFEYEMRDDYYAHLQRLPSEFYQKYRTGDLMARAVNDMNMVRAQASYAIMYTANTVFVILLIVPPMIAINARLTLLIFLVMPLVAVATRGFSKQLHRRAKEVQEYAGLVANRAQESLASMRITRAYAQEQFEIERFEQISREAVRRNVVLARLSSAYTPTLQFIVQCGALLVLCYGGTLVMRGIISIGQFVQFMLYASFLVYPMVELGSVLGFYERARVSMERVNEVMNYEAAAPHDGQSPALADIAGEIEFRNLSFTHKGGASPVLKEISLRAGPGRVVAVLGAVGSGKSTLMNLIPRVFEAEPDQLFIDGRPIQSVPLDSLRSAIGYVPQESFLFSETIADNIAFGAQEAGAEEIARAASAAELAADVEGFPQGYETVIGERGITLSGGQKQRVALARALIRRPRILLLDDALSSVDTYTEERILRNLRDVMRRCTSLIVSHRVSTVRYADHIVVLDDGRIAEAGTHAELIAAGGIYARICEKQALEQELSAS